MADFQGPIPFSLVDATDPTKKQIVDSNGAAKVVGELTITGGTEIINGTNTLAIDSNGSASVTLTNASIAVTASDLDIRSLTATTDTVSIASGSNGLTIDSNGAIPISGIAGTVTVGGSVSVSNTVTVSATDFDIRSLSSATDSVAVTGTVAVSGVSGTVTVDATDLDIRGLTAATDIVSIGSGTNVLALDSNGYATVHVVSSASEVAAYGASTNDIAKDSSFTFDYVVTSGKKFTGEDILVGSSTAVKVQVGTWDGSTFAVKRTFFQQPKLNESVSIKKLGLVGNGTKAIRIVATNLDASTTLYCSIMGEEV